MQYLSGGSGSGGDSIDTAGIGNGSGFATKRGDSGSGEGWDSTVNTVSDGGSGGSGRYARW